MAMRASSSSDAGVSIAAQPHQGSGTRNGRTMCGALMRSHTNAANLRESLGCWSAASIEHTFEAETKAGAGLAHQHKQGPSYDKGYSYMPCMQASLHQHSVGAAENRMQARSGCEGALEQLRQAVHDVQQLNNLRAHNVALEKASAHHQHMQRRFQDAHLSAFFTQGRCRQRTGGSEARELLRAPPPARS